MYIEIKEIGPDGLVIDKDFPFTLPKSGTREDEVKVGQVHLSGELRKDGSGVAFAGEIETEATLACSRCLEPYALPLGLHFDLIYRSEPEAANKGERRVDEESITVARLNGDRIDVDELVAEQIYLGLPLKPLCREGCRGWCPRCGTNLNLGSCGCSTERGADPRLAALKKLL
jgi:DUF177 domain-containing protein